MNMMRGKQTYQQRHVCCFEAQKMMQRSKSHQKLMTITHENIELKCKTSLGKIEHIKS